MMGFDVAGKVALVTGSNRGIGKAIVEGLLAHGAAKVYAGARDTKTLAGLVQAGGGKVVAVEVDLNRPGTIEAAAGACKDVQLVVNNAGIYRSNELLTDAGEAGLREEFEVNVVGPLRMARAFGPVLKANGGGAFAQLNSVVSVKSFASAATYSASKAASYSLTQALRDILGKDGTLVVSVHPGPIATDMATEAGFQDMAEPASVVSEALVASLKAGEFHCFPDRMAKQFWGAYESYARGMVEADMAGG